MSNTNENLKPNEESTEPKLSIQSSLPLPPEAVYYNSVSHEQSMINQKVSTALLLLISKSYKYKDFQNRCSDLHTQFRDQGFLVRRLFTTEECSPFLLKIERLKEELLSLEKGGQHE